MAQDFNKDYKETKFFKILKKLVSTSIIIHRGDTKRIVDPNKFAASTDKVTSNDLATNNRMKVKKDATSNRLRRLLMKETLMGHQNRRVELYKDYEMMDADPIISAALDIFADDSTTKNEEGNIINIVSDNKKVVESLENLFYEVLNVSFNLWSWIRTMCKYGDGFIRLHITEKMGITKVQPISSYAVYRIEEDDSTKFIVNLDMLEDEDREYFERTFNLQLHNNKLVELEDFEVGHFRLIGDSNYLPYGKSAIEGGRKVWKQIMLMEDAMLIHRVMRAPQKRIFKIDVGTLPPNEIDAYMEEIINEFKKVPYINETTGEVNLEFNLQNMLEDFYLPVRGGSSGTEIETLDGMDYTGVDDIEFLQRKLFASLKIPKSFLTFEEDINTKANLSTEDSRFARTIENLQKIVESELYKIAMIHLYAQGFDQDDLVDFELNLNVPSPEHEKSQLEVWETKIGIASSMKELKLVSEEWIYKNIFNFPVSELEVERKKIKDDVKAHQEFENVGEENDDEEGDKEEDNFLNPDRIKNEKDDDREEKENKKEIEDKEDDKDKKERKDKREKEEKENKKEIEDDEKEKDKK